MREKIKTMTHSQTGKHMCRLWYTQIGDHILLFQYELMNKWCQKIRISCLRQRQRQRQHHLMHNKSQSEHNPSCHAENYIFHQSNLVLWVLYRVVCLTHLRCSLLLRYSVVVVAIFHCLSSVHFFLLHSQNDLNIPIADKNAMFTVYSFQSHLTINFLRVVSERSAYQAFGLALTVVMPWQPNTAPFAYICNVRTIRRHNDYMYNAHMHSVTVSGTGS